MILLLSYAVLYWILLLLFSRSVMSNSAIPWSAAPQASLSFTISLSLLTLLFIESMMPSNHLIICHPLLLLCSIFPSIRVFSSESALPIRCPKDWNFSCSICPCDEYSGLISFRIDGLICLLSKGLWKVLSSITVWKHQIFSLSLFYGPTGKTIVLTRWTFVGKGTSLLFNMLSMFVIAFLTRSKHLLISWLQSPSAVI